MAEITVDPFTVPPDITERQSLAFSRPMPGMVVQRGEKGFMEELRRRYDPAQSNAAEKLVNLKEALRKADTDTFWTLLTEGLANIANAQYAFVSKRILVDDKNIAVELPPIGEPGACLVGAAFYINDGHGKGPGHLRNFKYHAYSCPCAYMKHDKIFIIPEKLNDFIINNPNDLVTPGEAYLGIPLFAEGKCFAHFGVMWNPEGAAGRALSWGYLEMLFHALEDMILERVLEGKKFADAAEQVQDLQPKVVPHQAVNAAQSLKPYARSLSHELRTPMQGVVGMLDVMMANVKEAAEGQTNSYINKVFDTLKENIEAVQDSSRRAVEAADNIVHAYDMNMGIPETPLTALDKDSSERPTFPRDGRPGVLPTGPPVPLSQYRGTKRSTDELPWVDGKVRVTKSARRRIRDSVPQDPSTHYSNPPLDQSSISIDTLDGICSHGASASHCDSESFTSPVFASEHSIVPGVRHANLRDVIQYVINDALKVGGRPDSAIAEETETGERIEVRSRSSNGQANTKIIEWMVSPDVPETILIDEKDLAKMVSCVALNAIKFTDNGTITLKASLSAKARYVVISIKDTGSGIPAAFLPNLFKPFSREDDSITRQSEGLGLGLMVAKGLARKLHGDLFCLNSRVSGPEKGTEFEIRVPFTPNGVCSRPTSPFGSLSPSLNPRLSIEPDVSPLEITSHPTTPPSTTEDPKDGNSNSSLKPASSPRQACLPSPRRTVSPNRPSSVSKSRAFSHQDHDPKLAEKYPLNILIVDDNPINRSVCRMQLQKLGYTGIQEAFDGNNAVEIMRQNAQRPTHKIINFIIMDLWMPLLDGFQATEEILKLNTPSKPIILAASADVLEGAMERAGQAGMSGFMCKPFKAKDLERHIIQQYNIRNLS